jgi:hypothetical protein
MIIYIVLDIEMNDGSKMQPYRARKSLIKALILPVKDLDKPSKLIKSYRKATDTTDLNMGFHARYLSNYRKYVTSYTSGAITMPKRPIIPKERNTVHAMQFIKIPLENEIKANKVNQEETKKESFKLENITPDSLLKEIPGGKLLKFVLTSKL